MLTHVLRNNFYTDWASAWWRSILPHDPISVTVDEQDELLLEWGGEVIEPGWQWSSGTIFKKLSVDITVNTIRCCWYLCRQYDDRQETSKAVTAALNKYLGVELQRAFWYWDDRDVLVSIASLDKTIQPPANVKIGQSDGEAHFVLIPDKWLSVILLNHLRTKAFLPQEKIDE